LELGGTYNNLLDTDLILVKKPYVPANVPNRAQDIENTVSMIETSALISNPNDSKDGM
jgi:hypothetical protein